MSPDSSCRMSYFYILSRIHKPSIPGRPIVSSCGYPTSQISAFVDHFLHQIVVYIPSYLKDSTHFLSKVLNLRNIPDKCLLVTCDVISLYTNIPQDEGINIAIHWIDNYRHILPSYTPANSVFKRLLNLSSNITISHITTPPTTNYRVLPWVPKWLQVLLTCLWVH